MIVVRWPRLSDFRFEKRKGIQKKGKFDLRKENSVRLCVLIFGSYGKVRIDRRVSVDFIFSSFRSRSSSYSRRRRSRTRSRSRSPRRREDRKRSRRSPDERKKFATKMFFSPFRTFDFSDEVHRKNRRTIDERRKRPPRRLHPRATDSERTSERWKTKKCVSVL